MRKRERLVRVIVDYWDLVLAILAAVAVAVLGVIGTLESSGLATATLAVLAALAGTTVRERYERRKTRSLTDAAVNDKPWHVFDETVHWDITSGDHATVTDERKLRFLDAETVAVWEFFSVPPNGSTGEESRLVEYKCEGGPIKARVLRPWPVMEETYMLDAVSSRRYRVISTAGIWKRGDDVVWRSLRKIKGLFPDPEEAITKNVLMPTDRLTLRVTWPQHLPPSSVRFRSDHQPERELVPQTDGDGRPYIEETLRRTQVGDTVNIRWYWR